MCETSDEMLMSNIVMIGVAVFVIVIGERILMPHYGFNYMKYPISHRIMQLHFKYHKSNNIGCVPYFVKLRGVPADVLRMIFAK